MAGVFVYVISGNHGRQKIGVSDDPRQRIRDLQTGSPFPLKFEFIGLTDGTGYDIEGEAHFLLHAHRAEGEWFVVPPEVAITAVMASARRLNHTIRPVDADNLAALPGPTSGAERWIAWTGWSLCMIVGFAILIATDHFLTALIGALLSLIVIKPLMRGVSWFVAWADRATERPSPDQTVFPPQP